MTNYMKSLLFITSCLTLGTGYSQTCNNWFPFSNGAEFEMTFYTKKDKMTSRAFYQVEDVKRNGNNYSCDLKAKIYDKKDEEVSEFTFSVTCENGVYKADISNFMNPALKESMASLQLVITGNDLEIPSRLSVGQNLPDAHTEMTAQSGPIKINMRVDVLNRKVDDKVSLSTPMGSLSCYKISSTQKVKMPLINRESQVVDFYSEGYGNVRSEFLDKKGELDSYMVMTHFKK